MEGGQEREGDYQTVPVTDMAQLTQVPEDMFGAGHVVREAVRTQPTILVGGSLKPYQMQGLEWLVSLYNNNLNGILADEMGLGKTIQSIAFISYLRERKNNLGPFLVVVPLSTLSNWIMEFSRWCPALNCLIYRGPPPVRKQLHGQVRQHAHACIYIPNPNPIYIYIYIDRLINNIFFDAKIYKLVTLIYVYIGEWACMYFVYIHT